MQVTMRACFSLSVFCFLFSFLCVICVIDAALPATRRIQEDEGTSKKRDGWRLPCARPPSLADCNIPAAARVSTALHCRRSGERRLAPASERGVGGRTEELKYG